MIRKPPVTPLYFDFAATTPCDDRVVQAMLPYFSRNFGNPSSRNHQYGIAAASAVETAREQVAQLIGATPMELTWMSGATEANNTALRGFASRRVHKSGAGGHIVTSSIEHSSVLEACRLLASQGYAITFVAPTPAGITPPDAIAKALRPDTILVSLCWANGEIGVVNDIPAVGSLCRERGIALHVDASQIVGKLPVNVRDAHVDLLTCSSHKTYGPKGVGALYTRHGRPRMELDPLIVGGGQENERRAGTLNVPAIVGFGKACALRSSEMHAEASSLRGLRDLLENELLLQVACARRNVTARNRLHHIANIGFSGLRGRLIDLLEDRIACSAGSACSSGNSDASHVLLALGIVEDIARNSLRLSLGRSTTVDDVHSAVAIISEAVKSLE